MYHVYFLQSFKNQKIYVGFSAKLPDQRLDEHNSGTNKWTRDNSPFTLRYYESYLCKKDAMAREKFYKSGFGRVIRDAILKSISALG